MQFRKIISNGIINHSAPLTKPILTPIITPPTTVIKSPTKSGGKLSAYATTNSPDKIISINARKTLLNGGKAMLISDLPANSHIEKTRKKDTILNKSKLVLGPTLVIFNLEFSLV